MNYQTIEFTAKCPSRIQILAKLKPLVKNGADAIEVIWGENWLKVERHSHHGHWYGMGHIRKIGADTLAKELNNQRGEK